MVGIYKITNKLTGECYIGQSKDIEKRFKEHLRPNQSNISKIIQEVGPENFTFEVIEECSGLKESIMDIIEDKWIQIYRSNEPGFGYNIIRGGQHIKNGELNNNVKLTRQEVYDIREAYKNHERKRSVYERYKDKVSEYYFSNLWEGRSWRFIHMDVYTPENIEFYSKGTTIGENSENAIFTDQEVLNMRKQYETESAKEIYESVKDRCGFQTLQAILWGRSYSHLPIYSKKEKRWINN